MVVQGERPPHARFLCFHPAVCAVLWVWNCRKMSIQPWTIAHTGHKSAEICHQLPDKHIFKGSLHLLI